MITQQELLTLFSMGTCVRTSDKFLVHTSTGRLLEVSAEAVRAYLKKDFNGVLSVDDEGYVTINGERTGYQLQPVNITDLQTRMDGLEQDIKDITLSGAGCQCSDMGERLTVPTADTQIKVKHGDEMMHITMEDIKTYLSTEYAPRWTDATCSISCTKAGISTLMEIGSAKPTASDFSASGSPASAVSAASTATGGALSSSTITITTSTATSFVAQARRVYNAGTSQVKTSKGNPTNKTASNATTDISSASVNSNIDASTFIIKSITKTATYSIVYVYALYANSANIGTVAKLALSSGSSVEISFPSESSSAKHCFDLPTGYALAKVEIFNTFSNNYENYAMSNFAVTAVTHKDASGTDVNYKRYTRNDGVNGASKFRITFTK